MIHRVTFKKPGAINTNEFSYVDMHYHTRYSDGRTNVTKAIKKCKKIGFGVAITDHNDIRGSILASRYKGVLTIPGVEVGVKEGAHLLLYFYHIKDLEKFYLKKIKNNRPEDPMRNLKVGISDILEEGDKYNSVPCAPHPFLIMTRGGICKAIREERIQLGILARIPLIEVINGQNIKRYNTKAVILANRLKKGITGGSDGHTTTELGKVLTYTERIETREEFLEELIKRKSHVIGKQLNIAARFVPHSVIIKKHMKHPIYWLKEGKKMLKEKNGKLKEKFRIK